MTKKKGKCNVFIVEDNLMYQMMIEKQFDPFIYDTHCFTKGESCVDQTKLIKPDILVLDFNLEGNYNGLETLREVRQFYPDVFAVVVSTEKDLDTPNNYYDYGQFKYIEKTERTLPFLQQSLSSHYIN